MPMDVKTVTINRDPFARTDLVRFPAEKGICDWCGGRNAHGKVYRYGQRADALYGRPVAAKGAFCGVGCYRSYHEGG